MKGGVIPTLTLRQEQVLSLVAQGKTDKEMADILGISPKTIDMHMGMLMERLGASSRAHAVALRFAPKSVTIGNVLKVKKI